MKNLELIRLSILAAGHPYNIDSCIVRCRFFELIGFIILMFFIEIVSRLENEWKVKWESLGTFSNSGISLVRFRTSHWPAQKEI